MQKIMVILVVLLLTGINSYAGNGDLTVTGAIIATQGVTFPDSSVQTTAKTLMWDYTVTGSAVTSVTSPTISGNTDGGYDYEFIICNTTAGYITPRLYYNNDQVNTDYWVARIGYAWANDSRIDDNIGPNNTYIARGTITITPSGLVTTSMIFNSFPNVDAGTWIHSKTASVTNLTRLDIVSSVANGIGINSRFRIWKKIR